MPWILDSRRCRLKAPAFHSLADESEKGRVSSAIGWILSGRAFPGQASGSLNSAAFFFDPDKQRLRLSIAKGIEEFANLIDVAMDKKT